MSVDPILALPHAYRPFYGAFPALRPLQRDAIAPILVGLDLIVRAPTGQGKTEAVVAPCAELLVRSQRRAALLYVVPTRALALDLRRRLRGPLERMDLKVVLRTGDGRWYGDGARADVLITTPESLDVALGSPTPAIQRFFERISAVIVDEAHALLGTPRGMQLGALLARLDLRLGRHTQRIALSATLAHAPAVIAQLGLDPAAQLLDGGGARSVLTSVVHLRGALELTQFVDDLYQRFDLKKLLMFARSRATCDELHEILSRGSVFSGRCFLHYSNLNTQSRKEVERAFRERREAICVATSTLELGIDIGDIDAVILYGPPDDVSGYVQRIGRAGRRTDQSRVWCVCYGERADEQALRFGALALLRSEDRLEQTPARFLPGVLVQQALSLVYERGEVSAAMMQAVWPGEAAMMAPLLEHLVVRRWLKGLGAQRFGPGPAYMRALKEQELWSNFPAGEEAFVLEIDGQSAATLPSSVVRQLKVGDRFYIAGERLKLLDVMRRPDRLVTTRSDEEETVKLLWTGAGFAMSWEVAQGCRALLEGESAALEAPTLGLMRRARGLVEGLRARFARALRLASGVRLGRDEAGRYVYWTFLGAAGNLILRAEAARWLEERGVVNPSLVSDGLCVCSSEPLQIESLVLPTDLKSYRIWAELNMRPLLAGRALNARCDELPSALLSREVIELTYDVRTVEALATLKRSSSRVIEGDLSLLSRDFVYRDPEDDDDDILTFDDSAYLEAQRALWPPVEVDLKLTPPQEVEITAQLVGEHIMRERCERLAALAGVVPPRSAPSAALLIARQAGQRHRQEVYERLELTGRLVSARELVVGLRELVALPAVAAAGRGWVRGVTLREGDEFAQPALVEARREGARWMVRVGGIHAVAAAAASHRWRLAMAWRLAARQLADVVDFTLVDEGFVVVVEGSGLAVSLEGMGGPLEREIEALRGLARRGAAEAPAARVGARCEGCDWSAACMGAAWRQAPLELSPWVSDAVWAAGAATAPGALGAALAAGALDGVIGARERRLLGERVEALARGEVRRLEEGASGLVAGASRAIWVELVEEGASARLVWWVFDARGERLGGGGEEPGGTWREAWGRASEGIRAAYEEIASRGAPQLVVAREGVRAALEVWDARSGLGAWRWLEEETRAPWCGALDVLEESFALPLWGVWTVERVCAALGLEVEAQPGAREGALWAWLLRHVRGLRGYTPRVVEGGALLRSWVSFVRRERMIEAEQLAALHALPLEERVERGEALGPLRVSARGEGDGEEVLYGMELEGVGEAPSRLREGDLLMLAPLGAAPLRGATVSLVRVDGRVFWIRGRRGWAPSRAQRYTLERVGFDATRGLEETLRRVLSPGQAHPLGALLAGGALELSPPAPPPAAVAWLDAQGAVHGLNPSQRAAWMGSQQHRLSLIQGPPGTGKTRLLGWIVAGWLARARAAGAPLRVLVTALTHRAIDQALDAVAAVVDDDVALYKVGRDFGGVAQVRGVRDDEALLAGLAGARFSITGATHHGLRGVADGAFDALICDEASQLRAPDAVMFMCKVSGSMVFVGDTRQLGPIVHGEAPQGAMSPAASILEQLCEVTPDAQLVMLTQSYRLNEALCAGPARQWYGGALRPVYAKRRLELNTDDRHDILNSIVDPAEPLSVVVVEHRGQTSRAEQEAHVAAQVVARLMERGVKPEQIGVLTPHRQQGALIISALRVALGQGAALPVVDTVERAQGSERDVIVYSMTSSDAGVIEAGFLLEPRRTNVALTRARSKLIVLGSRLLLREYVPIREDAQRRYAQLMGCLRGGAWHDL